MVAEPLAYRGRPMLTLNFPVRPGEPTVSCRAHCFRFCSDGTLRTGDNSVAAQLVDSNWQFGHRPFRELECAGPVILRMRRTATAEPVGRGPFTLVRTVAGLLFGDDRDLGVYLPAWQLRPDDAWHEITLLPAPPAP